VKRGIFLGIVRISSTVIVDLQVRAGVEVVGAVATPDRDQGHADVGQEVGAVPRAAVGAAQEAAVGAAQEAAADVILGGQEVVVTKNLEVAANHAAEVNKNYDQFKY